ncbi:LysR substrate-binding domain-containing protein, partial [Klebsiella pneumoniae]|nr:LysR substrate-binding domain-containing protein [Klebsiella pneumoniae]
MADLAAEPLIIYPRTPRPSYADQVLSLFRARDLRPQEVTEVRELQTALGLVAAQAGNAVVPAGVQRLRRDGVEYRVLDEDGAT